VEVEEVDGGGEVGGSIERVYCCCRQH